jgi:hypothetical protein
MLCRVIGGRMGQERMERIRKDEGEIVVSHVREIICLRALWKLKWLLGN